MGETQKQEEKEKKPRKKRIFPRTPAIQRFNAQCRIEDMGQATPCRIWCGGSNFNLGRTEAGAPQSPQFRRAAAVLAGAEVPDGYHRWDTSCKTEGCCAEEHLLMDGEALKLPKAGPEAEV